MAQALPNSIDLVVLDLRLAERTAMELRASSEQARPIIIVTGKQDEATG